MSMSGTFLRLSLSVFYFLGLFGAMLLRVEDIVTLLVSAPVLRLSIVLIKPHKSDKLYSHASIINFIIYNSASRDYFFSQSNFLAAALFVLNTIASCWLIFVILPFNK